MSETQIIPLSRRKMLKTLLGGMVIMAMCVFLLMIDRPSSDLSPETMHLLALAGLVFFGALCLLIGRRMFSGNHFLRLDPDGFLDRTILTRRPFIYWSDVISVQLKKVQNRDLIMVVLRDPAKYPELRKPLMRRLQPAANPPKELFISPGMLAIKPAELKMLMRKYLDEWMAEHDLRLT